MGVCGSSVCVSVLCVCVSIVCLCVVLTLWPVRRLVNLADATAQPQLQPSQDAPAWPTAFFLLLLPLPPSYMLLSLCLSLCRPRRASPHGILQFLWDFEIAFSTFAALANVAPTFHLSSPPRPGWLAAFNFSAVSPIVDAVVYPAFDCFTYPSMPHPSPPRIVGLRFLLRPATNEERRKKSIKKNDFCGFS